MIRVRRPYLVAGPIPRSKSWLNRVLVLRSLYPDIRILDWEPTEADGDDVTKLASALAKLSSGETSIFDIGESGTGFRFLLARLALEKGSFQIRGSKKLFERPHKALYGALAILGASIERVSDEVVSVVATGGPSQPIQLQVDASESSQFASSLFLIQKHFKASVEVKVIGESRSRGYLEMTESLIEAAAKGRKVFVPEMDASSIAALASIAVSSSLFLCARAKDRLASHAVADEEAALKKVLGTLRDLVHTTKQPDRAVFEILERLFARATSEPNEVVVDLSGTPDLFPVLAALSSFRAGKTTFVGAPHLRLKESDRISSVARLLALVGVSAQEQSDGLVVFGGSAAAMKDVWKSRWSRGLSYEFDPESDHRLAFAASVLAAGGVPIELLNRGVVTKSFPTFWSMVEGDSPRVALLGHRGTGKTEAAQRWAHSLGANAFAIDLDREVERVSGRDVESLFIENGEVDFRRFEREAWAEVDAETRNSLEAVVVSCGAGFDPGLIDDSWRKVWLRRATDKDGRIFLDRPRLNPETSPLEESLHRFEEREPRFARASDRCFEMAEGATARFLDPSEAEWVSDLLSGESSISGIGGTVTLRPEHNVATTCERLLRWGVSRIELRDDLVSFSPEFKEFISDFPLDRFLVSFRDPMKTENTLDFIETWMSRQETRKLIIDFPIELLSPEDIRFPSRVLSWLKSNDVDLVLSLHKPASIDVKRVTKQVDEVSDRIKSMTGREVVLKLAVPTPDFKTLVSFHRWAEVSPGTRVYLPTSVLSSERPWVRWAWYRLLRTSEETPLGLSFWREDDGSSLDQPTFSQWRRRRRVNSKNFAAILGSPVHHSLTPAYHRDFFEKRGLWIASIEVSREEAKTALPFLIELGLQAAAVTSPLKNEIVQGRSINTLALSSRDSFEAASTDDVGFEKLWMRVLGMAEGFAKRDVVVWGGGGVLPAIQKILPDARYFRASTGRDRLNPSDLDVVLSPNIVIWASGNERGVWPESWRPKIICDLSYTENSIARDVALRSGARYVSGLEMFYAQGQAQQLFWSSYLPLPPSGDLR